MKKYFLATGNFVRFGFLIIFALLFSLSACAQFQIVGMRYKEKPAGSVSLIILAPNVAPYNGPVKFDPNKMYDSGTTFKTPDSTSISIICKDQKQIMKPNSTLILTMVNKGITAKIISGRVQHILQNVKEKLSFYKAGNGYTWAHAEGTIFEVEAFEKSKKMKFSTQEGVVAVIEKVPITIAEKARDSLVVSVKGEEKQLSSSKKTLISAGEEYISDTIPPIEYATYKDALEAIQKESSKESEAVDMENLDHAQIEEMADHFTLLGALYLENGQSDQAIEPLRKALSFQRTIDPDGVLTAKSNLYLAEALIRSEDLNDKIEGKGHAKEIIESLENKLYQKIDDLGFANQNENFDLVWDIKNELVVICKYLGWCYNLLDDPNIARQYYNFAHEFKNN